MQSVNTAKDIGVMYHHLLSTLIAETIRKYIVKQKLMSDSKLFIIIFLGFFSHSHNE